MYVYDIWVCVYVCVCMCVCAGVWEPMYVNGIWVCVCAYVCVFVDICVMLCEGQRTALWSLSFHLYVFVASAFTPLSHLTGSHFLGIFVSWKIHWLTPLAHVQDVQAGWVLFFRWTLQAWPPGSKQEQLGQVCRGRGLNRKKRTDGEVPGHRGKNGSCRNQ